MKKYNNMTNKQLEAKIRELTTILDRQIYEMGDSWNEAYNEYIKLSNILDERYKEENQAEFDAFYKEHIEGKAWDEIDPQDWSFYSDWHKDMYGYRPHHI